MLTMRRMFIRGAATKEDMFPFPTRQVASYRHNIEGCSVLSLSYRTYPTAPPGQPHVGSDEGEHRIRDVCRKDRSISKF
jgi:hypothetical protein